MLPMNWPKVLSLFLWITPHVLLGVLAVVLYKRRLYREFPCFFVYVLYEIAEFILLFALYSALGVTGKQYGYVIAPRCCLASLCVSGSSTRFLRFVS
jgi:hypothetical protein